MDVLSKVNEISKRTEFKIFANKGVFRIVPPIRKHVKAIAEILVNCYDIDASSRVEWARVAGLKPNEENKYSFENLYSLYDAIEKVVPILFDIDNIEDFDFNELNEGEFNIALQVFTLRRKGI